MDRIVLVTILTIAVSIFVGQYISKRVFEPALATLLKEQTKEPEYRSPVDRFLDNF